MSKVITGLFQTVEEARQAQQDLVEAGLPRDTVLLEESAAGVAHYAGPRLLIQTDDYTADVVYKVFTGYDVAMSVDVSGNVYENEVNATRAGQPSSEQWHEASEPPGLTGISLAGGSSLMTPEGTHTGLDTPGDTGIAKPKATRTGEDAEQNERRIEPPQRS